MSWIEDPIDPMAYQVMQVTMQAKGYAEADCKEFWIRLLASAELGNPKAQRMLEAFRDKVRKAEQKVLIERGA